MQWHEKRERAGKIASLIGICCNVLLAAAKIAVGWISGMISVAADGLNNLSDCGGSAVSLLSFRLSSRPADEEHPLLTALGDRADFVRAVLQGDRAGQKAYCTARKKLPDAVVDEINDLSVEYEIYDMILETDDLGNCRIIEDYYDMIADLLQE